MCGCVVLASSGIDYDIKLWMPMNEQPQFDEAAASEVRSFNKIFHVLCQIASHVATCICFCCHYCSYAALILLNCSELEGNGVPTCCGILEHAVA